MHSLVVADVSYAHGPETVLSHVSLVMSETSRLGVVGPNGAGKSTLLRLIAGELEPDEGSITASPPSLSIGFIPQEREAHRAELVADFLARRTGVAAASASLDEMTSRLSSQSPDAADQYADALEHWMGVGGADLPQRAQATLTDLGFGKPGEVLQARTDELSGGQLARVALASILLGRYDVVLLDEPTNDLDFAGLALLEQFVIEYPGAVAVVSHDRAFLERTITSVLELDEHSHRASVFNGGWSAYLEERQTRRAQAEEAYAAFRSRQGELIQRAQRQREWAVTGVRREAKSSKDHDKAQRDFRVNRTEKLASKVRSSERQLDRLAAVEKPWEPWQLNFSIAKTPRSGDVVARLRQAVFARGSFLLGPIDLEISAGERVAITGANGTGKTTLIDGILGRLALESGEQFLGRSVVAGELDQGRAALDLDSTVLRAFGQAVGEERPVSEVRSLLAKFGVGAEHVQRLVKTLSPGERTRVTLALFMARGVNFLVLDEPTNHLDLPAIEQLEMALDHFESTLLVVTHDRQMLETLRIDTNIELVGS